MADRVRLLRYRSLILPDLTNDLPRAEHQEEEVEMLLCVAQDEVRDQQAVLEADQPKNDRPFWICPNMSTKEYASNSRVVEKVSF